MERLNYSRRVFGVLSALLNTLAGGNPDNSLSARSYYLDNFKNEAELLRRVIDWAFYPYQGEGHCRAAYETDTEETFYSLRWYNYLILVPSLSVLLPLIWLIGRVIQVWKI